jgi:hypothetical protein
MTLAPGQQIRRTGIRTVDKANANTPNARALTNEITGLSLLYRRPDGHIDDNYAIGVSAFKLAVRHITLLAAVNIKPD